MFILLALNEASRDLELIFFFSSSAHAQARELQKKNTFFITCNYLP